MDISTGSWFKYLREEVLAEGLRDIGLPEYVVDYIEAAMPAASTKARMYAGTEWKKGRLTVRAAEALQFNVVNELINEYGDYVTAGQPGDVRGPLDPGLTARSSGIAFDDDADDGPFKVAEFDDEQKKHAEQVKFVIQNLKNIIPKPMGTWQKAFNKAVKNLSKLGMRSEKVEYTQKYLGLVIEQEFNNFYGKYDLLWAWLNEDPTNYEYIKGEKDINEAYDAAQEELNNKEDPDFIMHTFDDGSYWYNLDVSNCPVEAERMGHCGGDSRGTLVSLRKKKGKRRQSSSYVTMTWSDDILYQIKGRANDAPPMEVWDHIDWFIKENDIRAVQETGEHSSDHEGIQEMIEYLASRNRGVNFHGSVDIEEIDGMLQQIANNYEGEQTSVSAETMGPEEHGGEGVYIYMNGYATMEIELRWKGFKEEEGFYIPTLAHDDNTPDDSLSPIPINSWGNEARGFEDESGFDTMGWDMPGEDTETEWSIGMKESSFPSGYEGDMTGPGPMLAVLTVEWRTTESEGVEDADDAERAFENFSDNMQQFDEEYEEKYAEVRTKMSAAGYIPKTVYDRDRDEMSEYDMDHWKVWSEKAGIEFWFRPHRQSDTLISSGGDAFRIPTLAKMWGHDALQDGHLDGLWVKVLGGSIRQGKVETSTLNKIMGMALQIEYKKHQETTKKGQEQLPFGEEYAERLVPLVLAKDSRFIIEPRTRYPGHGSEVYPEMTLQWRYTIGVDHTASSEEVQAVKDIVKYFNDNPDLVELAAASAIKGMFEPLIESAEEEKEAVLSGSWPANAIRQIDDNYGPRALAGEDTNAEMIVMIAKWIHENFDQMSEPEKHVAWYRYLKPMWQGYFRPHTAGTIELDDDANIGKPEHWNQWVKRQMKQMNTYSGTVSAYGGVKQGETQAGTLGEPQAVGEHMEDQIDRIEKLLKEKDESYDLRLYSIKVDVSIQKNLGGEIQETQTEIRGIEGVTTVRTVGETRDAGATHIATYEVKFELIGSISRVRYRDQILLPGMMRVKGLRVLRVTPVHRTNKRGTIRTVRENRQKLQEYGLGGSVANLAGIGMLRDRPSGIMKTPRMTLQHVVDDWASGGVMAYDRPMDARDMRYHVMMPVEELWPYHKREFRAPKDAFDGMYRHFIQYGAEAPVYIAIGKNGRVKITGNEDLIWFAKKAGLKDLPVFLSYQSQV
jgi:hypothetical protein